MIYLQCTKPVLDHLGVKPKELAVAGQSDAALGNWSAANFVVDGRHIVLFMNDRTLLSFLLFEGRLRFDLSRIPSLLLGGFGQLLSMLQVPEQTVRRLTDDMKVIAIARTKDRALTGNMSALVDAYKQQIYAGGGLVSCDLTSIILGVNDLPQRRLGWMSSVAVLREILAMPSRPA